MSVWQLQPALHELFRGVFVTLQPSSTCSVSNSDYGDEANTSVSSRWFRLGRSLALNTKSQRNSFGVDFKFRSVSLRLDLSRVLEDSVLIWTVCCRVSSSISDWWITAQQQQQQQQRRRRRRRHEPRVLSVTCCVIALIALPRPSVLQWQFRAGARAPDPNPGYAPKFSCTLDTLWSSTDSLKKIVSLMPPDVRF